MNIKEVTVTARASRNYQVFEASMTAEDMEGSDDMIMLKELAISNAVDGLKKLEALMDGQKPVSEPVKTTVESKPATRTVYQAPHKEEKKSGKITADDFPVLEIGKRWNPKNCDVWYEKKFRQDNNSHYMQICNEELIDDEHPKYVNVDSKYKG